MNRPTIRPMLIGLVLAAVTGPGAMAQDTAAVSEPVAEPVSFVTDKEGRFAGERLKYEVTAGETHLTNSDGDPTAALFSFAYVAQPVDRSRPVTFIFNGGPGSASVWLHMGAFGPKRVIVPSDADEDDGAAPYQVVDNPDSLLAISDLVFIDPVGTGYSRIIGEGKPEDFWSMEGDARSIAQFMRRWVTDNGRWNSPKYILGESFGTTRAATVTEALEGDGQDMALNGLVLVSQALDYTGSTPTEDNLIAFVTYLPTMAATARYHGKAGQDVTLPAFVAAARTFATDVLAPALFKGSRLTDAERDRVADGLVRFTGLDRDYILRSNLRVTVPRFIMELLRDEGQAVGRLDARYTGNEPDLVSATPRLGDAASYGISSAYTAALNDYVTRSLGVQMDRPYYTSGPEVTSHWIYRDVPQGEYWEPSYLNVARKLSHALRRNGDLKVLVASGYYDLVTPFFDAEYTFARHAIPPDQISYTYYEAGHMMYVRQQDFDQLVADVKAFYGASE